MNRKIKILLLAVIVSLSALIFPFNVYCKNMKIKSIQIQKSMEMPICTARNIIQVKQIKREIDKSINFEIDKAVQEMNQRMEEIKSIEDKKEWYIAYKSIIDEYSCILDSPETIYDYFTEEELDLLFHVVQAEVGDEYSFEQKVNVAEVIFNRLDHERFPDTLLEILTADQFQPISSGRYKTIEVSKDTILACEYAFQIETDKEMCLFFDSNNSLNYEFVYCDDAHNFYKYRED